MRHDMEQSSMIMEGSWFQAIIVRGKKENFYDVDMGIHFHAWDPRVVRCTNVSQGVQGMLYTSRERPTPAS